jgi:hypothetical protein
MADYSVNDLLNVINQQIESRETLSDHLWKADALVNVAARCRDFFDYPTLNLHYYLLILSDIIEHAKAANEQSLKILLRQRPSPITSCE